jgi:hypothetical protein
VRRGSRPSGHQYVGGDEQDGDDAVGDHERAGVGGAAQERGAGQRQNQLGDDRQLPQAPQLARRERQEHEHPGKKGVPGQSPRLDRLGRRVGIGDRDHGGDRGEDRARSTDQQQRGADVVPPP